MKVLKAGKGFTLVELMIVVGLLAILAIFAVVKVGQALEQAREGATKGNIGQIMAAISVYYGDNGGYWPVQITDSNFQNYLAQIPAVKITHPANVFKAGYNLSGTSTAVSLVNLSGGGEIETTNTDGWIYNQATGNVFVNNSQTDTTGVVYTMYGYQK